MSRMCFKIGERILFYMVNRYYIIAGLKVFISMPAKTPPDVLKDFIAEPFDSPDLAITFINRPIDLSDFDEVYKDHSVVWYRNNQQYACVFYTPDYQKALIGTIYNEQCDTATVYYEGAEYLYYLTGPVGEILFRNALIQRGGIMVHAAAVRYKDSGIFFSAQAGTGKTTHARLWVEHLGASILNGDRPAITVLNNKIFLNGSPWSGSSPQFENKIVPLQAMVFLERAAQNSIQKLDASAAISKMMPRCFLPYYSKKALSLALDNIDYIVSNASSYVLKCRPDKEAMEKVLECVRPTL